VKQPEHSVQDRDAHNLLGEDIWKKELERLEVVRIAKEREDELRQIQSQREREGGAGQQEQSPSVRIQRQAAERRAEGERLRRQAELSRELERQREEERLQRERVAREEQVRQEGERLQRERMERERLERERERERLERQRLERERLERERLERERVERERLERERAERERVAREAREAAQRRHRLQLEARWKKEAAVVEQYVVLDHSLVTCGAGLDIQHIVTGFELCRITIKNLPKNATKQEIENIFIQQGVPDSHFCIIEVRDVGHKREGVVLANAEQGQAIALGLEGIEFRQDVLKFEVTDNASANAMDAAAARGQPFLNVNWKITNGTIIATYASNQEARTRMQQINALRRWKGHTIEASLDNHQRRPGYGVVQTSNPTALKLAVNPPNLPCDAAFMDFVGTTSLRTLKSFHYDAETMHLTLRRHFGRYSALTDTYEVLTPNATATEQRIKVQFSNWEDVKRAHDSVDKTKLPTGNGSMTPYLRAWHPKPLQYSIKIPGRQYEAQKKQWDALSEKKPGSDVHLNVRIGQYGDVFIQVMGEDKKAAGTLKVRVESMVAGEALDPSHWHPSFMFMGRTRPLLDRIHAETRAYIRSDFKTRSLKVYGDTDTVTAARRMIKAEVDRLAEMETSKPLDRGSVGFFMREGLSKLKELIGDDNVNLNLSSRPCTITIKGGEEARHHLQRLIDESRSNASAAAAIPNLAEGETCPICYDDVSNPEPLGCGHTYCSGCLKHFLASATDTKTFPLVCMGDEASCNTPISIPLIQRFLPAQAFYHLVEVAFSCYLEQHSQELKYCTTADCKQIYRRQTGGVMLQCPSCFSEICPACDEEAHEGMTCQERRQHKTPEEQERLFNELAASGGMKKCPQCSVWIEKSEGCNHMECNRCHTHFCWRCMGVFSQGEIYQHMNSAHGGMHDEVPAGINVGRLPNNVFVAEQIEALAAAERERARRVLLQRRAEEEERARRVRDAEALEMRRRAINQQIEIARLEAEARRVQEANPPRRVSQYTYTGTSTTNGTNPGNANSYYGGNWDEVLAAARRRQEQEAQRRREEDRAAAQRRQEQETRGGWCIVM